MVVTVTNLVDDLTFIAASLILLALFSLERPLLSLRVADGVSAGTWEALIPQLSSKQLTIVYVWD
jgi:hypothetical protein